MIILTLYININVFIVYTCYGVQIKVHRTVSLSSRRMALFHIVMISVHYTQALYIDCWSSFNCTDTMFQTFTCSNAALSYHALFLRQLYVLNNTVWSVPIVSLFDNDDFHPSSLSLHCAALIVVCILEYML